MTDVHVKAQALLDKNEGWELLPVHDNGLFEIHRLKRFVEDHDTYQYRIFPRHADRDVSLRLDWEITREGMEDNLLGENVEDHALHLFEFQLMQDVFEAAETHLNKK
jgi:hypothetical protein